MARQLGVGVVGLGPRWRRYRRAMGMLQGQVAVRAVHDRSLRRAEQEAQALGCEAVGGVVELLDRKDVQAVLILNPGWLGLWPLEEACRAGKPALWAGPLREPERWNALAERYPTGPVVRPVLSARIEQAVALMAGLPLDLGSARLVRLAYRGVRRHGQGSWLGEPIMPALLLACSQLFGLPEQAWPSPDGIQAVRMEGVDGFEGLLVRFPGGRVAQLSGWWGQDQGPRLRFEVEAEHGLILAEVPGDLRWFLSHGSHGYRAPRRPPEVQVLSTFVHAVRSRSGQRLGLAEVRTLLGWLRRGREG